MDSTSTNLTSNGTQNEGKARDDQADDCDSHTEDNCSICLHHIEDRTVVPKCSHEFCFECLIVWTEQSRRCPLCSQIIGEYLIHNIRSRYDYRKHYLTPLRTSPPAQRQDNTLLQNTRRQELRRRARERRRRQPDEMEESDRLESSITFRRWIYQHDLYAKHVASNSYTKYRPYPTPAQFTASPDLISRTITFLRRELQVWEGLDVEFLTTLIISLMKSIDIRSESAVKLLSEFLDLDAPYVAGGRHVHAEHFAHEVYCYVRSPYRDLFVYDTIVQYDTPPGIQPPEEASRRRRWHQRSVSPSPLNPSNRRPIQKPLRGRSRSKESARSMSWSPSGRQYSSQRGHGIAGPSTASTSQVIRTELSHSGNEKSDEQRKKRRKVQANDIDSSYCGMNHSSASSSKGDLLVNSIPMEDKTSFVLISPVPDPETADHVQRVDLKGKHSANEIEFSGTLSHHRRVSEGDPSAGEVDNATVTGMPEPEPSVRHLRSRDLRMPRNRNLRESVQAYLSGGKDIPHRSKEILEQDQRPPSDLSHTNSETPTSDPIPSLLSRMLDSSHTNIPDQAPRFSVSKEAPADIGEAKALSIEAGDIHLRMFQQRNIGRNGYASTFLARQSRAKDTLPPSPSTRPSFNSLEPDGLGRRVNIIQSKADPTSEQCQAANKNGHDMSTLTLVDTFKPIASCADSGAGYTTILHESECSTSAAVTANAIDDFPMQQIPQSCYPSSFHVGSLQQFSIEDNPIRDTAQPKSTSISDDADALLKTRTKLMARLAQENQLASSTNSISSSAWSDNQSTKESNGIFEVPRASSVDDISEESKNREEKLRLRAQLQVRLATEKRKGGIP